jgi:hypothetical protein
VARGRIITYDGLLRRVKKNGGSLGFAWAQERLPFGFFSGVF